MVKVLLRGRLPLTRHKVHYKRYMEKEAAEVPETNGGEKGNEQGAS
jgi:hypothetical protein